VEPVPYAAGMTSPSPADQVADQLIDAQVAYVLGQLTSSHLEQQVAAAVDDVLALAGKVTLNEVVDPASVKVVVRRLLASLPVSAGASELVEAVTEVVHEGPATQFTIGDLTDRDQVESLVDALLAQSHMVDRALGQLADSPLVGTVASRFMGRIVGEVLQANRAMAEKVPGLGTLMSFGTGAASKMMGAADKQFEGLLGDATGKGAALAVRRLNKILVETLRDPTTREAILQVWGEVEQAPVVGLGHYLEAAEVQGLAYQLQSVVATAAGTEHAAGLADAVVDAVFRRYGEHPTRSLVDDLGITRDHLVADIVAIAPQVLAAANADGSVERIIRARVEPFFRSPEVSQILGQAQ